MIIDRNVPTLHTVCRVEVIEADADIIDLIDFVVVFNIQDYLYACARKLHMCGIALYSYIVYV